MEINNIDNFKMLENRIKKLEEENTILRNCHIDFKDKIEILKWRINELEWKVDDLKEGILELESSLIL